MSALATGKRGLAAFRERLHGATPRERMMLAGLLTVVLLLLLSGATKWLKFARGEGGMLTAAEESGRLTLERAPAVDAALKAKADKFQGKRISASNFFEAVDGFARESGLNADMSTPRADKSGGLTIYRMKVNLRAPSLRKLMDFDDRLRLKGQGYVVERVTVDARASTGELSAAYELATCQPSE